MKIKKFVYATATVNYKTYEKSVAVMIDKLPAFDSVSASALIEFLKANGYAASAVVCDEIAEYKNLHHRFNTLIIPQCQCTPSYLMTPLSEFVGAGGHLLTLGGPIFYDNIVKSGEEYVVAPMPNDVLDANFLPENDEFIFEGFSPAYKVYKSSADSFRAADSFGSTSISTNSTLDLICPISRNHGAGYFERRERFIPLTYANEYDAAAFIMLSQSPMGGHDASMFRPGSVYPTTFCRALAGIGIKKSDILSVDGAGKLILSVLSRFERGMWLFDAGIDCFRPKKGQKVKLGAGVMNTSFDFKRAELEFFFNGIEVHKCSVMSPLHLISKYETEINIDEIIPCDGTLVCRLTVDGKTVDEIRQDIKFRRDTKADSRDFVSVRNGRFYIGDNPWQAVGINYWPSCNPSLEFVDYWRGWLDSTSYDPIVVERDIKAMKKLGINCLFTRVDTFDYSKLLPCWFDFVEQLRENDMRLCLSAALIETPTHYNRDAFEHFISVTEMKDDPVVFAHDISWEVGPHDIVIFRESYTDEWNAWIKRNYKSADKAIEDWGFKPETVNGLICVPIREHFENDGEHRIYVAAFRRFMDEHMGRIWLDAVTDMRKIDPQRLYTFRQGPLGFFDISYTVANTVTDFVCPEAYHLSGTAEGYAEGCFETEYLRALSGGQPIAWSEYGKSLCGTKMSGFCWDHENFGFNQSNLDAMSEYLGFIHKMLLNTRVEGSAPWWWPGGFRRTELSDFGYCDPSGNLRPCAIEYGEIAKQLWSREKPVPTRFVSVDRDVDARGNRFVCSTLGVREWLAAEQNGEYVGVKLDGDGTDTKNLPDVSVGNIPYDGKNPHKYLMSLFKTAELTEQGIKISFFNTGVAKWCHENTFVRLTAGNDTLVSRIDLDTERLGVASAYFNVQPEGEINASMFLEKTGEFGEQMKLKIKDKEVNE